MVSILQCESTWLAENRISNTNSCQLAQSERGTHQNMNSARAELSVQTGSRFSTTTNCCPGCRFTTKPKNLNYSVADPPSSPGDSL